MAKLKKFLHRKVLEQRNLNAFCHKLLTLQIMCAQSQQAYFLGYVTNDRVHTHQFILNFLVLLLFLWNDNSVW